MLFKINHFSQETDLSSDLFNQAPTNNSNNIVPSGVVCFGIHRLHRRFPKNPKLREEYIRAINGFIVYLNNQRTYPHKIDVI